MKISVKTAAVLSLALLVGGCDAGAQLAAAGAVALFGLGAAAISEGTKNQEAYCQSGSQVYTQYGGCGSGSAISSEEYQRLYKERAERETESKIAAADAARSAKTYCLSNISQTPYIAASGSCQPDDHGISEDQYRSVKEEQVKSLTAPPSQPINENAEATEIAAVTPQPQTPKPVPTPSVKAAPENQTASLPQPASLTNAQAGEELPTIPEEAKIVAAGSAFFVAPHGILLTNHHVIDGCKWVGIIGTDGKFHSTVAVADSAKLDLAVLRSDIDNENWATFSKQSPDLGDNNFVAGYPLIDKLMSLNFTQGIISSDSPLGDQGLLQTTAAIQHGNSGGPMFDESGHVIGVIEAKLKDESAESVGFAIKSEIVESFMSESGVAAKMAARGSDRKANTIAREAKSLVFPAVCLQ